MQNTDACALARAKWRTHSTRTMLLFMWNYWIAIISMDYMQLFPFKWLICRATRCSWRENHVQRFYFHKLLRIRVHIVFRIDCGWIWIKKWTLWCVTVSTYFACVICFVRRCKWDLLIQFRMKCAANFVSSVLCSCLRNVYGRKTKTKSKQMREKNKQQKNAHIGEQILFIWFGCWGSFIFY